MKIKKINMLSIAAASFFVMGTVVSPVPQPANAGCVDLVSATLVVNTVLKRATVGSIQTASAPVSLVTKTMTGGFVVCGYGASTVMINASPFVTAQACKFRTAMGGTCRLRAGDGLPVELLGFGVK